MQMIEFLRDVKVRDAEGREYKKGCIEEMSEASARHWVIRNAARYIQGKAAVMVEKPEVKVVPEVQDEDSKTVETKSRKASKD